MDIICRKTQCKYNDKYTCTAQGVDINKQIMCATFKQGDKEPLDYSKHIFDRVLEYAPHRASRDAHICCKAKCFFNNKCRCEANGITINVLDEKPHCITFLKK